jgi:hypothetical protein
MEASNFDQFILSNLQSFADLYFRKPFYSESLKMKRVLLDQDLIARVKTHRVVFRIFECLL